MSKSETSIKFKRKIAQIKRLGRAQSLFVSNLTFSARRVCFGCLSFALLALAGSSARAAEWLTDLPAAQAAAKAENKIVLLDFTGSDWCGWCIRLRNEVFSKPEFDAYANDNLVLVEVDFPRQKSQSAALKQANRVLA